VRGTIDRERIRKCSHGRGSRCASTGSLTRRRGEIVGAICRSLGGTAGNFDRYRPVASTAARRRNLSKDTRPSQPWLGDRIRLVSSRHPRKSLRQLYRMSVHGRPRFAKQSVHDGLKDRLHPYIRTFDAAYAAVPDGIGWSAPIRFFALQVLRTSWVWPTTV
jgi:hypothetical protein